MESNQKSSLEVKVQDIKIILPNKKDYKISIILSLGIFIVIQPKNQYSSAKHFPNQRYKTT